MQQHFRYYSLPILSGILIGTSYIPFPPWALLFCITPLWLFWQREKSLKKIFISGWMTQFILNAIGFHWIAHTTVEFGRMPWPAGLAVLLLFCTCAHLYYPIAGVLWKFLINKLKLQPLSALLLLPFVFIFCERLYPFIFYWHFGYPWLWASLPGYQVAEWIGFFGINLLTLIINSWLVIFWLRRKPKQWLHPWSISALSLFIAINLLGLLKQSQLKPTDRSLRVALIQGNIGNLEKIQAQEGRGFIRSITDTYLGLSRKALEQDNSIDLVVWPETAFPETMVDGSMGYYHKRLADFSNEFNVPLLTGAYQRKQGTGKFYNSLVLIKGGQILGEYQKTHLLAFGEYLPFGEMFPRLKAMLPMVSDFGRGPGPSIIEAPQIKVGAQICYEGLFDDFSTELQQKGAQLFVNVTNDSWFGYPFEPYQHMYMTLARAIENRRPLIRSTNTGISTVILADGTIKEFSPRNEEWIKTYDIAYHSIPRRTFYVNLSQNWPWILVLIMLAIVLGDRIAATRKH